MRQSCGKHHVQGVWGAVRPPSGGFGGVLSLRGATPTHCPGNSYPYGVLYATPKPLCSRSSAMFERETTHAERVAMIERHLAGASLQTIATALYRNYFTVRTIWRTYQQHGWAGIAPKPKGPPQVGRLGDF